MCLAAMVHPCDVCFVSSKQVGSRPLTRLQLHMWFFITVELPGTFKIQTYIPLKIPILMSTFE